MEIFKVSTKLGINCNFCVPFLLIMEFAFKTGVVYVNPESSPLATGLITISSPCYTITTIPVKTPLERQAFSHVLLLHQHMKFYHM